MKKVSHIAIAQFVLENIDGNQLIYRRKSFQVGNVLPDCKPSFITKRHTKADTEEMIWENANELIDIQKVVNKVSRINIVKLGEICHYIGDYFTFPHNRNFTGTMREHIVYEYNLRDTLKHYLSNDMALSNGLTEMKELSEGIFSLQQLRHVLEDIHEVYLGEAPSVIHDCKYIANICYLVVATLLKLAFSEQLVFCNQ